MYIKRIILILILVFISSIQCSAQDTVNYEIDILNDPDYPIVEVSINGSKPYRFLFDTGANGTVLSKSLVNKHRLEYESAIIDAKGFTNAEYKFLKNVNLSIGSFKPSTTFAFEIQQPENREESYIFNGSLSYGILGMDVFLGCTVDLDGPNMKILVSQCDPDAQKKHPKPVPTNLTMPLSINDVSFNVLLDTGARLSGNLMLIRDDKTEVLFNTNYSSTHKYESHFFKDSYGQQLVFKDVIFSNQSSQSIKAVLPPQKSILNNLEPEGKYSALLDWRTMRQTKLQFVPGQNSVKITAFPDKLNLEYDRSGLGGVEAIEGDNIHALITKIYKGSPLWKAGVKVGDKLKLYNGTPIYQVSREERFAGANAEPGTPLNITIVRDNVEIKYNMLLQDYLIPQ